MTIIATILSYNSVNTLPDVIAGVDAQTLRPDRVLIVDNASTDGTVDFLKQLPNRFEKRFLDENLGVGAGHNTAFRTALNDGCHYVWTLENDSIPPKDCLAQLATTAKNLEKKGVRVGCVTPTQVGPDDSRATSAFAEPRSHATMTFNGALIRTDAISTVGFIREDFFMDQEDREYAARMWAAGISIYKDPSATIVHLGKSSNRSGPQSVLRTYYRVRNQTFSRKALAREPLAATKSFVRAIGGTARTLLHEDDKLRRIQARWRGTTDGVRGNLGKKDYQFLEGG